MRPINQITITGRAGHDAEHRATASGKDVMNVRIAHTRSRFNKETQQWEDQNTTWWNVSLWDKNAAAIARDIPKGTNLLVTGRAEMREYQRNDGSTGVSMDLMAEHVAVVPDARPKGVVGGWEENRAAAGVVSGPWNSAPQQSGEFGSDGQPPF